MKKHSLHLEYQSLDVSELNASISGLLAEAVKQLSHSYSPYSGFQVGAALILENGEIIGGCNQENASYPLCLCGERVALYTAGSKHPKMPIQGLFIVVKNTKKKLSKPASPCGACRQVIAEFEVNTGKEIPIYIKAYDTDEILYFPNASTLLPFSFSKDFLE